MFCSKEAQKCYCGSSNCRGFIGSQKSTPLKTQQDSTPKPVKKREKRKNFDDVFVSSPRIGKIELGSFIEISKYLLFFCVSDNFFIRITHISHSYIFYNYLTIWRKKKIKTQQMFDLHKIVLVSWSVLISSVRRALASNLRGPRFKSLPGTVGGPVIIMWCARPGWKLALS